MRFEWSAIHGRDHVDASPEDAQDEGDALKSLTIRTNQIGNNFLLLVLDSLFLSYNILCFFFLLLWGVWCMDLGFGGYWIDF